MTFCQVHWLCRAKIGWFWTAHDTFECTWKEIQTTQSLKQPSRFILYQFSEPTADSGGRAVWGVGLWPLDHWDRAFKTLLRAWKYVSCVCCVLCTSRFLRRADHSLRGVLQTVCEQWVGLSWVRLQRHSKINWNKAALCGEIWSKVNSERAGYRPLVTGHVMPVCGHANWRTH